MKLIFKSLNALIRKPFIAIFMAIIFGAIIYASNFLVNLFLTLNEGGNNLGGEQVGTIDYLITSLITVFNWISDPKTIWIILIPSILGIIIIGSGIFAIGMSGAFNSIVNVVKRGPKQKNAFLIGMKKYFLKTWLINAIITTMFILFLVVSVLALVPSLLHLQTGLMGDSGHLWIGIGFSVLSIIVIIYCMIYFIMYITFWYPALFNKNPTPFKTARGIVNENFFGIFLRFLLYLAIFIGAEFIINLLANLIGGATAFITTVPAVIKWLIYTLYASFGLTYIFVIYDYLKEYKQ